MKSVMKLMETRLDDEIMSRNTDFKRQDESLSSCDFSDIYKKS